MKTETLPTLGEAISRMRLPDIITNLLLVKKATLRKGGDVYE